MLILIYFLVKLSLYLEVGIWGTGINKMIQFVCYVHLVCHEKPEWLLRAPFTTSLSQYEMWKKA